jgi:hypothetical protein
MTPYQELLSALQMLVEEHELLLVQSRVTKRDAALMLQNLPLYTASYRALIEKHTIANDGARSHA